MHRKPDADWLLEVGERLAKTRDALDVKTNQPAMAKALGVKLSTWNNYETGIRTLPVEVAIRFCEKTKVSLDWIYRGDPDRLPANMAVKILGLKRFAAIGDRKAG